MGILAGPYILLTLEFKISCVIFWLLFERLLVITDFHCGGLIFCTCFFAEQYFSYLCRGATDNPQMLSKDFETS